jgi:hypothetical protein
MVDEWGGIWKDAVVAELRHMAFASRDRKMTDVLSQYRWCLGLRYEWPEYKSSASLCVIVDSFGKLLNFT